MAMANHQWTDPSDAFLITAPSYKIMRQSTLPAYLRLMKGKGTYLKSDAIFEIHGGGTVYFRTETDPDSVVGITNVRHIWGDEAGKYSLYFWENLQARAAFCQCPIDLTTSPYSLNWIYQELIKPHGKGAFKPEELLYIQAASNENPYFPHAEYESRKAKMDPRRFRMMFGGMWERMEGLVYDCFDPEHSVCDWPAPSPGVRYFAGVDWGYTEPFAIWIMALYPDGYKYQVSEVKKARLGLTQMIDLAKEKQRIFGIEHFFCDPSQPGHIQEFNAAGLKASPANNSIRLGIDKVYGEIATRRLKFIRGACQHTLDEMEAYHYPDPKDVKPDKSIKEDMPVQQNDHLCLAADTEVTTPSGPKRVCDVVAGDHVLTPVGFKRVLNAGETGTRQTIKLTTSAGKTIQATADHPFYVPSRGFVRLDAIRYCDNVPTWKNRSFIISRSIFGTVVTTFRLVDALRVAKGYTLRCGRLITDRFRKVSTSTIGTMTEEITIFLTSKSWKRAAIVASTTQVSAPMNNGSISKKLDLLPLNGTEAKRAENGTGSTGSRFLKQKRLFIDSALCAARSLRQRPITPDFARTIVSQLLDAKLASTMFLASVLSVLKNLARINTLKQPPARGNVLEPSSHLQSVYNLTVDGAACFFANGFVVSNCDAMRYCVISTMDMEKIHKPHAPSEEARQVSQQRRIADLMKRSRD